MKTITEMLTGLPHEVNPNAVALLERRLADAKAGKIFHIALVSASAEAEVNVETVGIPSILIVGAAQIQRQMLERMFPSGSVKDIPNLPRTPSTVKLSS